MKYETFALCPICKSNKLTISKNLTIRCGKCKNHWVFALRINMNKGSRRMTLKNIKAKDWRKEVAKEVTR